ncbi:DUF4270 family protein [Sinomicrobium soli]|uniref:DUF4270 family protein n=1 Tax=Sinomicrobium sp. N-1-3-6 TaxID=2219864 RepID=UPI000DCE475F|nr:DUF4270 family protein [Sinomicrobium sp. N-1-3-6]RAV27917.1 hypothetical protein DN748_16050 [Sinomicrobium sp. N-1-3-6]
MKYLNFLLLLILFCSCGDDNLYDTDFNAGQDFTGSNVRVLSVDSLTIDMSTVKFDSLITSDATRILLGQYTDTVFGKTTASSFFELLPDSYSINNDGIYDSISLFLNYDRYYYNDTLQPFTIQVKELTSRVKPSKGDSFYNTSIIPYQQDNLGQTTFYPKPLGSKDSVEIKLSDSFGEALFDRIQQKKITTADQMREYFKGITLQPGTDDDGAVLGFSTSSGESFMRIYYATHETEEPTVRSLDLHITTGNAPATFFNRITSENEDTPFANLTDQETVLPSGEAGNKSYIQGGTGLTTRIRFPSVKSLYELDGKGTLLSATMKIKPTPDYYDKKMPLRDTLSIYVTDLNNDISGQLTDLSSNTVFAILNRENQEFNQVYYEISLTSYIESILSAEREDQSSLILIPGEYGSRTDRFVLNGQDHEDFGATLEILYSIYDANND